VPNTLVASEKQVARGLAGVSPSTKDGIWGKIIGGPGKTQYSRRLRDFLFGDRGNTIGIDEPQPPYGTSYTSSGRPLFASLHQCGGWRNSRQSVPLTFRR